MELTIKKGDYLFKKPVSTPFGKVRFLTMGEHVDLEDSLNLIGLNVLHFYYMLRKNIPEKDKEALKKFEEFKTEKLLDIVYSFPEVFQSYVNIFYKVLDCNEFEHETLVEIIQDIMKTDESFLAMRKLILDMNIIKEEKVSENEELQYWFDIDKKEKLKKNNDAPELSDFVTSIVAKTNHSFAEVEEMSMYQAQATFERIDAIVAYDTTTLYRSVGADVKVDSWAKKIDLFNKKDSSVITKNDFDKLSTDIFK